MNTPIGTRHLIGATGFGIRPDSRAPYGEVRFTPLRTGVEEPAARVARYDETSGKKEKPGSRLLPGAGGTIAARLCFDSMKAFKELLIYLTVIGVLVLGLGAGSMWLIRPEPTMKAEAKAPVVPQKVLDSIERRKPISVEVVAPVPAAVPVMQESPASLPQPVVRRQTIREVSPPTPKAKRRQSVSGPMPIEVPIAPAGRAASAPVATSRTDFPY